jgi:plastocyanin
VTRQGPTARATVPRNASERAGFPHTLTVAHVGHAHLIATDAAPVQRTSDPRSVPGSQSGTVCPFGYLMAPPEGVGMTDRTTRRRLLALGGTALATTLAGCGEDGRDGGGDGADGSDGSSDAGDGGDTTPTDRPTEEPDQEILVGPGGSLVFDPAEVTVSTGATVQWTWESDFHTVTVESQPEGENWNGTGEETYDEGYTHVHTFSTAGTYEYFCQPHRGQGMVGTLTVE